MTAGDLVLVCAGVVLAMGIGYWMGWSFRGEIAEQEVWEAKHPDLFPDQAEGVRDA